MTTEWPGTMEELFWFVTVMELPCDKKGRRTIPKTLSSEPDVAELFFRHGRWSGLKDALVLVGPGDGVHRSTRNHFAPGMHMISKAFIPSLDKRRFVP